MALQELVFSSLATGKTLTMGKIFESVRYKMHSFITLSLDLLALSNCFIQNQNFIIK